jgi:hypothetical protein
MENQALSEKSNKSKKSGQSKNSRKGSGIIREDERGPLTKKQFRKLTKENEKLTSLSG